MNNNYSDFTVLASNGKFDVGHTEFTGDAFQAKKFAQAIAKRNGQGFKPVVRGDGWQWIEQ